MESLGGLMGTVAGDTEQVESLGGDMEEAGGNLEVDAGDSIMGGGFGTALSNYSSNA